AAAVGEGDGAGRDDVAAASGAGAEGDAHDPVVGSTGPLPGVIEGESIGLDGDAQIGEPPDEAGGAVAGVEVVARLVFGYLMHRQATARRSMGTGSYRPGM